LNKFTLKSTVTGTYKSNTLSYVFVSGGENGAAINIEYMLTLELLWLACRHHIFEIVIKGVFLAIMGKSTGAEVVTFKILQKWKDIDRTRLDVPRDYPQILDISRREAIIAMAQIYIVVCSNNLVFFYKV